jgi:outer membrane lipoprotein SlyB
VPLTWRPAETQDNTVQLGAVAGAVVAGPMGAAAGGFTAG